MERLECGQDDIVQYGIEQTKLFWNSKNYEEYAVKCDLLGMPCLWSKDEFDLMHDFFVDIDMHS